MDHGKSAVQVLGYFVFFLLQQIFAKTPTLAEQKSQKHLVIYGWLWVCLHSFPANFCRKAAKKAMWEFCIQKNVPPISGFHDLPRVTSKNSLTTSAPAMFEVNKMSHRIGATRPRWCCAIYPTSEPLNLWQVKLQAALPSTHLFPPPSEIRLWEGLVKGNQGVICLW